jgi:hypothetical protein
VIRAHDIVERLHFHHDVLDPGGLSGTGRFSLPSPIGASCLNCPDTFQVFLRTEQPISFKNYRSTRSSK